MSKTATRTLAAGISALAILAALACGGNETQTPPAQTGQNDQPAAAPAADQGQAAGVAGAPAADQQQPNAQQNPQGTQPGQQPQQQPNTPPPSGN